jgi:hypothetical protein
MVDYKELATQFGSSLTKKDFALAHSMLCQLLQEKLSPESLKQEFESMISYGEGLLENVDVMEAFEDWPAKQQNDIGWAYVAITGQNFSEAVSLIISNENGQARVREIEWGRP